jgi:hypothetical protein
VCPYTLLSYIHLFQLIFNGVCQSLASIVLVVVVVFAQCRIVVSPVVSHVFRRVCSRPVCQKRRASGGSAWDGCLSSGPSSFCL